MRVYRELDDPRSDLARWGREQCARIEKATGKPTYYYLMRYFSHRSGEESRPCPLCGRRWAVRSLDEPEGGFSNFFFRCERCRLVSGIGVSLEGARRARIGDFRSILPNAGRLRRRKGAASR
jgi:predicted  nucleic acid-binding Zn ribbon protein